MKFIRSSFSVILLLYVVAVSKIASLIPSSHLLVARPVSDFYQQGVVFEALLSSSRNWAYQMFHSTDAGGKFAENTCFLWFFPRTTLTLVDGSE